jgi:hypothetical protein
MSNRRDFLAAAGALGAGVMASETRAAPRSAPDAVAPRELYELRRCEIKGDDQKQGFDVYMRDAAIPALNRIGIAPVGVFYPEKDPSPIIVLLPHRSMESFLNGTSKLMADTQYLEKGTSFLNAPAEKPAFQRVESSLLLAFKGMPALETPVKSPGRILQLRIYESPSVKTGRKKIEMFNDAGEIAIFRRVGLHPVFFGEALAGSRMPNLTYMLAFESAEELKANWSKFGNDPDWKRLKGMPEYSDKAILSGITNLILKPAAYSQI